MEDDADVNNATDCCKEVENEKVTLKDSNHSKGHNLLTSSATQTTTNPPPPTVHNNSKSPHVPSPTL